MGGTVKSSCLIHLSQLQQQQTTTTTKKKVQGNLTVVRSCFKVKGNSFIPTASRGLVTATPQCENPDMAANIYSSDANLQRNSVTFQRLGDIIGSTFLHSSCPQVTVLIVIRRIEGTDVHLSIRKQNSLCYTVKLTIFIL